MHKLSCHTRLVLRISRLCVGVNTHTLHTKIFIKVIQSKILKKHKLCCHTRLVLLIPALCVGVNPHTLHTKIFIKEIQSKILKKHKLSCHTRVILLMPQPCAYNYQGPVFLADVYIFHASFFRSVVRSNLKFLMTLYHKYLKLILTKRILDTPAKPGSIIAIRFLRELSIYVHKDFVEICRC